MGTENDRWRCIGKVLQAISCEGFNFFVCYKEVSFHLAQIHFIIFYLDLPFWALKYT